MHGHTVTGLEPGRTYVLGLRARWDAGPWSELSNPVIATAAVDHDRTRPAPVTGLRQWAADRTWLTVAWAVAGDDSIHGTAAGYEVRWSRAPIDEANWDQANIHAGASLPASKPGLLQTTITGLADSTDHWVAVRAVDDVGLRSGLGTPLQALTDSMRIWYVNVEGTGDLPTIEEAAQAARVGDIVLVAPGRYTWTNQGTGDPHFGLINVPRNHTGFTIVSEAGAEATIIDAERHGPCMVITGVVLGPGEDVADWPGITVDGFTLTGGRSLGDPGSVEDAYTGAGLTMHLNSAHIRNCIIRGNEATQGGGLWYGGQGEPIFENLLIEDNVGLYGGGMLVANSLYDVRITGCTIRNNRARGQAGGLLVFNLRATVADCVIEGNVAEDIGGGLLMNDSNHLITLRDVLIRGNRADHGAGLAAYGAPFRGERVTIVGNVASGRGGAMLLSGDLGEASLDRCTITGNDGRIGAVCRTETGAFAVITGSLIARNVGGQAFSSHYGAGFALGCSDVWGNLNETAWPPRFEDLGGNFSADPLFCGGGDYRLDAASPCLPGQHPDGADCGVVGALGPGCGNGIVTGTRSRPVG